MNIRAISTTCKNLTLKKSSKRETPSILMFFSVTHTTRRPKNEREKLDYNCIKMQDFEQDVTQVHLLFARSISSVIVSGFLSSIRLFKTGQIYLLQRILRRLVWCPDGLGRSSGTPGPCLYHSNGTRVFAFIQADLLWATLCLNIDTRQNGSSSASCQPKLQW